MLSRQLHPGALALRAATGLSEERKRTKITLRRRDAYIERGVGHVVAYPLTIGRSFRAGAPVMTERSRYAFDAFLREAPSTSPPHQPANHPPISRNKPPPPPKTKGNNSPDVANLLLSLSLRRV